MVYCPGTWLQRDTNARTFCTELSGECSKRGTTTVTRTSLSIHLTRRYVIFTLLTRQHKRQSKMASGNYRFHVCPAALLFLVAISCLAAQTQAVDCRKFVFAPVCRGIIAKRTISETRSSLRPDPSPRQWGTQYGPATEDEDDGLLLAQSYEDPASLDSHPRKDMVLVRAGGDIVPAYVYGIFERGLQEERK
ncbi:uncharacterized protein [Palaemon carinicauda]|uniref:uncharacterized protein isoform X2 n=1 Tax=Palaemon carinicauda TaxID=392227 RepID=UPI0035B619B0